MTTLSAARTRGYTNNQTNALPISTSTTIWGGAAVGIDPTTRLGDRMRPGYLFVGFAKSSVNHIPGQQRDNFVTVIDSGEVVLAVSGAVQADVGKDVYATDDDTFVLTSSGGSFVGVAKQLVASGKLLVEIAPVSMLNAVRLAPGGTALLVDGDRNFISSGVLTRVNLRDWNGFDNTGTNSMRTIMQAAVEELETFGAGRIELERGTYAMDGNLTIRGGDPTLNGGYQGGTELIGQSMTDTVLQFSTGGIIVDCGPAPTHGNNSALAMLTIAKMKLVGPGKGVGGSVGIDVGPQGVYQSTPNAVLLDHIWFNGFENHARFDDTTSLWVTWCYFINYVKALRFGYNQDTMSIFWNRFGDNQVAIGSQTGIAMAWDYISARHGSGGVAGTVGVAPNAAAMLGGAQNHAIKHNWFVRQALVADIADPSASNITFEHNQFESCKHYAKLGNTNTTTAPSRVEFTQNVFMRTDGEEQTQAMFLFPNTGASGSLALIRNVCDTATGPKAGWVQCGTGSTIEFDNNALIVAGGYVTEANHLIVGASGKKVVLSSGAKYTFGGPGSTGGTIERQGNFSGRDNTPDIAHWGYNTSASASIYQRWQAKGLGSDAVSGNAYDIKSLTVNGTRFATASGFVQPLSASSTPSLGSDGSIARAGLFFKAGGAGVADELYCCMKSAADTYSWKLVATG